MEPHVPWPGQPQPLGATYDGAGTNFALYSEVADQVVLCLIDREGNEERLPLPERTGHIWHGYVPEVTPGQRYGYRVFGPSDASEGHHCDPSRLLLDPYAKAIDGAKRSLVISPFFDWRQDQAPRTPWNKTLIYELHVKGFTKRHPGIPKRLQGTYAGLAHPAAIAHFKELGVTAVELMPIQHFAHERFLRRKGLRNYWGYASIGYFAPHGEYASQGQRGHQVAEFKTMVRDLHAAGLEVILDVVYNHTGEGGVDETTLNFRGIDNRSYYRTDPSDPSRYVDYTGTGNTLNVHNPFVLKMIADSLRYWVTEMHVDGFRFDLAPALARGDQHRGAEVDMAAPFLQVLQQDPVLSQVKLIAEPWDLGPGGYRVGQFPPGWSEWNGKYRDCVRDFWRGEERKLGELAHRLTGSEDLFGATRRPFASVNFITSHDGFPLRDLVAYNQKHNEANLEENRDGTDDNRSWNCGTEGPTDDAQIKALRRRQQRNFLATLLLSQGTPLLTAGDELGRTQGGNNNAYCQDSPISWLDWENIDEELYDFTKSLIALRKKHPLFQRRHFFEGLPGQGPRGHKDITWFRPDGQEMQEADWKVHYARTLGIFLNGQALRARGRKGAKSEDTDFFLVLNGNDAVATFALPFSAERSFEVVVDTHEPSTLGTEWQGQEELDVPSRSVLLLRALPIPAKT